jgi:hypothetical protein
MRLAQDEGVVDDPLAAMTVTYDLSCPFGVKTPECPFGSVHNVNKTVVCERIALQMLRLLDLAPEQHTDSRSAKLTVDASRTTALVTEGPRAMKATAVVTTPERPFGAVPKLYAISVKFHGGTAPFYQAGTQYCATCCGDTVTGGVGGISDFDVSVDGGATFVNGTVATVDGTTASFGVMLASAPTHVRYTANQGFPQCAVYNQEGFPAYPFVLPIAADDVSSPC